MIKQLRFNVALVLSKLATKINPSGGSVTLSGLAFQYDVPNKFGEVVTLDTKFTFPGHMEVSVVEGIDPFSSASVGTTDSVFGIHRDWLWSLQEAFAKHLHSVAPAFPFHREMEWDDLNGLRLQVYGKQEYLQRAMLLSGCADDENRVLKFLTWIYASSSEQERFLWTYRMMVAFAMSLLKHDPLLDGHATYEWTDLVGTSRSMYFHRARELAGIDHDTYLEGIRNGTYSVPDELFDGNLIEGIEEDDDDQDNTR